MLKKKLSNFIGGLTKKEKEEAEKVEETKQEPEQVQETKEEQQPEPVEEQKEEKAPEPESKKPQIEEIPQPKKEIKPVPQAPERPVIPQPASQTIKPVEKKPEVRPSYHEPAKAPQQPEPKITFTTRLKSVIFRQVKIGEKDADPFIEALKMDLLQSDVNYDVAQKIAASIRSGLVGKPVDSKDIQGEITQSIRTSILNVISSAPEIDIVSRVNQRKEAGGLPFKIMFIGPNGAGKTTTMAKIANLLLSNKITCVLSASDTFRAAAIEQTVHHAGKLGINVIKGNYGSDPASVAFDAIAHAKAHGINVVLIDSAGRQETNKSLIEELKKMTRVTAPDLKIFVGEAISGNALLEQVKAINEAVKIDGIILTKLDVDAKGGNTLSILSDTTVPILFFGTGEKYTDIMRYDPKFIIDSMLPNN